MSTGLNYSQKNRIKELFEVGNSPKLIAECMRYPRESVEAYCKFISGAQEPKPEGDEFGPLPGSAGWDDLSAGAKSGLTRKRNRSQVDA